MNYKEAYTKSKIKRFTDVLSILPFSLVMLSLHDSYLRQGFLVGEYVITAQPLFMAVLYSAAAGLAVVLVGYATAYFYACEDGT